MIKQNKLQLEISLTKRQKWIGFGLYTLLILVSLVAYFPTLLAVVKTQIEQTGYSRFSALQFSLLSLVQPFILALFALLIGQFFFSKVGLRSLLYERTSESLELFKARLSDVIFIGIGLGAGLGIVDVLISPLIPELMDQVGQDVMLRDLLAGIFYGGIIEEVMLRFGFMSAMIYFMSRTSQQLKAWHYWVSIILVAIIFALGHLPATLQLFEMTIFVWLRLLLMNGIVGIVAGYIYWQNTLESAIVCHMMVHVGLFIINALMGIVL